MNTTSLPPAAPSGRFHELDSLRAVAALGVVCWHYVNAFHSSPFGHVLSPFYRRGLLMVDFFFILSGFVLARAFWNEKRSPHFPSNVWSRVGRLYPLHLSMLFLVAILQWYLIYGLGSTPFKYIYNDAYHFALNLFLIHNSGLQNGASFNAPSWSISTEFLINIAFFALISLPRIWAVAGMAALGLSSLAGLAVHGMLIGGNLLVVFDGGLVRTSAGFFVGVALFNLHKKMGALGKHRILWDLVAAISATSGLIYLATPGIWSNYGDILSSFIGFPVLIYSVTRSRFVKASLSLRPIVYLGEISYSIYLVHFPLQLAIHIFGAATGVDIPYESRWLFLGFMAAVVGFATITYRLIELPGQRFILSLRR